MQKLQSSNFYRALSQRASQAISDQPSYSPDEVQRPLIPGSTPLLGQSKSIKPLGNILPAAVLAAATMRLMYTLITTAKLDEVSPRAWPPDVLRRVNDHPATRLHELLLWNRRATPEMLVV